MTKRPLPPVANNDPPHLAQRDLEDRVAVGEDLLSESQSLDFGVTMPEVGRSRAASLMGVCSA